MIDVMKANLRLNISLIENAQKTLMNNPTLDIVTSFKAYFFFRDLSACIIIKTFLIKAIQKI